MRASGIRVAILPLLLLWAALSTAPCIVSPVRADTSAEQQSQQFESSKFKFSLRYPPHFEPFSQQNPLAPLVLKSRGSGFPSFNVIVESGGNFNPALSISQRAERIVAEYRRVGLSDARLETREAITVANRQAYQFEVRYSSAGAPFSAFIVLLPGAEFLYTLTYIDRTDRSAGSLGAMNDILRSFQTTDRPFGPSEIASTELKSEASFDYFFWAVLGGVLILFIAFALRMRRRIMPS